MLSHWIGVASASAAPVKRNSQANYGWIEQPRSCWVETYQLSACDIARRTSLTIRWGCQRRRWEWLNWASSPSCKSGGWMWMNVYARFRRARRGNSTTLLPLYDIFFPLTMAATTSKQLAIRRPVTIGLLGWIMQKRGRKSQGGWIKKKKNGGIGGSFQGIRQITRWTGKACYRCPNRKRNALA